MTTIVLTVSRLDYLYKVLSRIELLECEPREVNLLCVVDGNDALYVRARNMVAGTKFNQRLCVKSTYPGQADADDFIGRKRRLAANHNQAGKLIEHQHGFVFSVEDDTLFKSNALKKLMNIAVNNRAFGSAVGVEVSRRGKPHIGAWQADDIYNLSQLVSIENIFPVPLGQPATNIDAGGLYCTLIRADLYKQHTFTVENGLGPDINFGLENRQLGFENFIAWDVPCTNLYTVGDQEILVQPSSEVGTVKLTKKNNNEWSFHY